MSKDEYTPRMKELIENIKPILHDGEFCLILSNDLDGVIVVPDDVTLKGKLNELHPVETIPPIMLAHHFLTQTLSAHAATMGKALKSGVVKPPVPTTTPKIEVVKG